MTLISDLRSTLQLYGIDDTQYTDAQLQIFIDNAKSVIGEDYVNSTEHEDYVEKISCRKYMTNYYPVVVDSVVVIVDGEQVTAKKITTDGIIYFDEQVNGEFTCTYLQGIDTTLVDEAIVNISLYMIQEQSGNGAISSINEGDISVSYDTNSIATSSNRISQMLNDIRGKYKARVRLI